MSDPGASRFIPDLATTFAVAPLTLLWALPAAAFVAWLRTRREVRTPYTRKIFHFIILSAAMVVQVLWGLPGVVVFGSVVSAIVLFAVWRGDGFAFYEALARPTDAPRRTLFILVPLLTTALGGMFSNLLFPAFAHIGYMVVAWGDAVGEPVGTRWGRHRYSVPSIGGVAATRSLEGSAAVAVAGGLAALLALLVSGIGTAAAVGAAAVIGVAAALVEAVSHHGLDNLTLQVAAAGVAVLLVGQ